MKKASKILLIVAFIIGLIAAIGCLIGGVVVAVLAFVSPELFSTSDIAIMIKQAFAEMEIDVDEETLALIIKAAIALVYLIFCIIGFIVLLIVAIVAKKGTKAKRQGILIANIIFGLLGSSIFSIVGGVLGIIALKQEANRAAQPAPQPQPVPAPAPVIEPEPEPEPEPASEDEMEPEPAPAPVEEKPVRTDWYCPNCGAHNNSKFCQSCGTKKPE